MWLVSLQRRLAALLLKCSIMNLLSDGIRGPRGSGCTELVRTRRCAGHVIKLGNVHAQRFFLCASIEGIEFERLFYDLPSDR